jgi:hypothetical protein
VNSNGRYPAQQSPHDASRGGTPPRPSLRFIAGGTKHMALLLATRAIQVSHRKEHSHPPWHRGPPVPHFPTVHWVTVERKPGRGHAWSLMCLRRPVIPPPPSPPVPTSVLPTAAPTSCTGLRAALRLTREVFGFFLGPVPDPPLPAA